MTVTRAETGSEVVEALEHVWATIRERHPEVPDVVIITGSTFRTGRPVWGHFGPDFWANGRFVVDTAGVAEREHKPELLVSGERLGTGAAETVQTMLHEAAHAVAAARGVQDTSRQHRYHNRRFLEIAEELGLEYRHGGPDPTIGFSAVEITDRARDEYAEVIAELDEAMALSCDLPGWIREVLGGSNGGDGVHVGRRPRDPGKPKTGYRKAVCGCDEPRVIRVAASTLDEAPISCGACGEDFHLA
ncbi:MAG: hypothetical protein ACOC9R_01695 [bacterium]